jgi:hypothetical protein
MTKQNHKDTSNRVKLAYSAPKLRSFGSVGALTQAGSGVSSEVMSNGMASMSPNQRA